MPGSARAHAHALALVSVAVAVASIVMLGACARNDRAATPQAPAAAAPESAAAAAPGELPEEVTPEMAALAARMVEAIEHMGRELTAAGTDCARGTEAIRAASARLRPLLVEVRPSEARMSSPAAEAWFDDTYGVRIINAAGRAATLAQACAEDPGFQAALEDLEDLDL